MGKGILNVAATQCVFSHANKLASDEQGLVGTRVYVVYWSTSLSGGVLHAFCYMNPALDHSRIC